MSKLVSFYRTYLLTAFLLAYTIVMAKDADSSSDAMLGPFLLISPARNMTLEYSLGPLYVTWSNVRELMYCSDNKTSISVPQLFIRLSTDPNSYHPTPEGTFDLALVDSTRAMKIRAKESKTHGYILAASVGDTKKGYLAVSEEDEPGLAKYRTFFFVDDPEAFSRTTGKKIWYEDFKLLDRVTQPLEIGLPGRWGDRPRFGGRFALVNG
jgi:hypothetical protein